MPDTTLSTILPSMPVKIGMERLHLRSVIIAELPVVERVIEAWRLLVAKGGDFLHADGWEDFLDLCAAAVGRPRAWIDGLSEEDFERLIALVLAANEDIWKTEATRSAGEPWSWAKIAQRLVEHGHTWAAAQGYTLPQAKAFLDECFRVERENLACMVEASNYAMATPESTSKTAKELRRG